MNLKRLPIMAFGVLALATIGAFFLVQLIKTGPPLVWGDPGPKPSAIDPIRGRRDCVSATGERLDYRRAELKIALPRADSVGVYVVSANNAAGPTVATISSGTPMPASRFGSAKGSRTFTWNGRLNDGVYAPDGTYYFRIVLQSEGRSIDLSEKPLRVVTQPPRARVVAVRVAGKAGAMTSGPAIISPPHPVKIRWNRGAYRRVWLDIYRTDVAGKPQLVATLRQNPHRDVGTWNGEIAGQPAPAGTYLVGITAQNLACDQAHWPIVLPPSTGTTPGAGLTIRYLSVTPPLTPTVSGSRASVAVDSPGNGFTWSLRRAGVRRALARGAGSPGASVIHVRMPRQRAGLYTLVVRSGTQRASVPLVASKAGAAAAKARVLVVAPMLTWVGNSPVDDTGDGLPDTLAHGDVVSLSRPLVNGLPATFADDQALLRYLDAHRLSYQLTTDVALAESRGPSLVDRWGVLFPDGEDYLPASLATPQALTGFVKNGGRVLALGTGTFAGKSPLGGLPGRLRAGAPHLNATDPFGARRGPLTSTEGELITELADPLGLFGGGIAFSGITEYQPIEPPGGTTTVSAAGIAYGSPAIVGFEVGSGYVIEVGLPDFGSSLQGDVDSQELLNNAWQLLAKRR